MYNFRYHLITIVSIFVSLALGLLLGAAIASSDLAQSTTDDMIDSLLSRYDTLTQTNTRLEQEAQDNLALAAMLRGPWANNRLEGRTIVVLLGNSVEDVSLRTSITATINSADGNVVGVTVEQPDFGLGDEDIYSALQEIVSEEPGVDYQQTLAQNLVDEWSYAYVGSPSAQISTDADFEIVEHRYSEQESESSPTAPSSGASGASSDSLEGVPAPGLETGEPGASGQGASAPQSGEDDTLAEPAYTEGELSPRTPLQKLLHERYPLTTTLLLLGVISIDVDYSLLAEHTNPSTPTDQAAVYSIATAWQLPYGVNGIINGFAPTQGNEAGHSQIGLYLTQRIHAAGVAKELPYPNWLKTSIPTRATVGNAEQPNYHALLIQPAYLSSTMEQAAGEQGLSCVTSPNTVSGQYSLVALLSGSQAGIYGANQVPERRFAPLPEDTSGRVVFR